MKKYLILIYLIVISVYCFGQARRLTGLHPTLNTPGYIYYDTLKILTAIAPIVLTDSVLSITGSALTKVDDANVTMTLGGTPTTALLAATSMSLGWTGTLAATRGGTSFGTTTLGDILVGAAGNTWVKLPIGTSAQRLAVVGGTLVYRDTAAAAAGGGGLPDSAYFWQRSGNVTTAGVDFLGTRTNISLPFKTNNAFAGVIDSNQRFGWGLLQPLAKMHVVSNAIGVTATTANSILFENQTAATLGNPQWSPGLILSGKHWNTVGSASQDLSYRFQVNTLSGANTQGSLLLQASTNGGAYGTITTWNTQNSTFTVAGEYTQSVAGGLNSVNKFIQPLQLAGSGTTRWIDFVGGLRAVIGQETNTSDIQVRAGAFSMTTGTAALTVYDSTGKVSVNNPTHSNDYSSGFNVTDTARGITIPSMTTTQRDSIGLYVSSLTITNGGSGYTGTPTVIFATATYPFRTALASGTQSGGVINTAPISFGGFYARTPANPVVTGGAGTGAVLTPVMAQRLTTGLQIFNTTLNVTQTWDGTRWVSDAKVLAASATLDFGSTIAGVSTDLTVTCTGAADGDVASVGVPNGSTLANGVFTCWVSAANTVTVRFTNPNLVTTLDPASGTFKVKVFKD